MIATSSLALMLAATTQQAGAARCADPQSQAEMNLCATLDFERADTELNRLWSRVIADERVNDREPYLARDGRPSGEAVLRQAQRAWITFRDAHCTHEGYEARGGSLETLIYQGCRARLTRERIAQLSAPPAAGE